MEKCSSLSNSPAADPTKHTPYSDAAAGIEPMTRRLELRAEGEQVVLVLTMNIDDAAAQVLAATRHAVQMRAEDLFALIEAYVAIAY